MYDVNIGQQFAQLVDTKGCLCYAVHEASNTLAVGSKRKLAFYQKLGQAFVLQKEFTTLETPRVIYELTSVNAVVVGYKRHYEMVMLGTYHPVKFAEADREHRLIVTEVAAVGKRPQSVLVSNVLQGLLFDINAIASSPTPSASALGAASTMPSSGGLLAGLTTGSLQGGGAGKEAVLVHGQITNASTASTPPFETRLEWNTAPIQTTCVFPYLFTLEANQVEIHYVSSLAVVQTVRYPHSNIASSLPLSISSWSMHGADRSSLSYASSYSMHTVFAAHLDSVAVYPMNSLPNQVSDLAITSSIVLHSGCRSNGS